MGSYTSNKLQCLVVLLEKKAYVHEGAWPTALWLNKEKLRGNWFT